jgi:intergrase/recombinase
VLLEGGEAFYVRDMLAARYADYLLHHPNQPIASFDLEAEVQPEKAEARAWNSLQADSDARALHDYREALGPLRAEKARAQAAGEQEEVARLEEDIRAYESLLKGGGRADTGQRAYDNVRKAFRVLMNHLKQGGPEQRAFAEHLRTHLSIGLECLYSQPDGRIWR